MKVRTGSLLVYAMAIIAIFIIVYMAFFLTKIKPSNPYTVKQQYEELYFNSSTNEDTKPVSDFSYQYSVDSLEGLYGKAGDKVGSPAPVLESDPEQVQVQSQPQPAVQSDLEADPSLGVVGESSSNFTSKINPKISLDIPSDAQVFERGTEKDFIIDINMPQGKNINISVAKTQQDCSNLLIAFGLQPQSGVGYRLLHPAKEISLKNNVIAIMGAEEYGTNNGLTGFRGTLCALSAISTKFDIKAIGWGKSEEKDVYRLLEQIMSSLTV